MHYNSLGLNGSSDLRFHLQYFAFCAREDQLIEFHEGFYNADISGVEVNNLVFDDSKSSSSSSSTSVSLPSCVNRSALQISLPFHLERCSLPLKDNAFKIRFFEC
ncbi:hypothetical protein ACTFIU_009059 [Dictyostelium citrinum]